MGLGIVISDRQQEFLNWICKVELYCVVSLHDAWACGICWCVWFLWSPHWEVTLAWAHDLVAALPCIHKLQWWPLSNSFNHHIMPLSQDFQRAKTLGYSPRLSGPQQSHRRAGWAMCSKIACHPQLAGVTFRYWAWFSSDLLAPSQNTDAEGRMMLKGVGVIFGVLVYLWLYNAPSRVSYLGSSLVRLLYPAEDGKSTLSLISSSAGE